MANVQHSTLVGADLHTNKLHVATHQIGGTDVIPIDTLGVATDNTALDVSIGAHGLTPKLPNDNSKYLNGVGGWGTPGGVPSGSVVMWMTDTVPVGWLECAGASILRTSYAALFAVIGTKYGNMDGTHFTLPDLRGYFPRGWDHARGTDPNAAARTDRGDGTTGDHVGTKQPESFQSHTHTAPPMQNTITGTPTILSGNDGSLGHVPVTLDSTGGSETRPINMNVMYIIKT